MGDEDWLTSLRGSIGCIHGGGQIVCARPVHIEDVPTLLLRGHYMHGCFGAQHGAQQIGLHHFSDLLRACVQEALQGDNRLSVFILHTLHSRNDSLHGTLSPKILPSKRFVVRYLCRPLSTALREMCKV